MVRSGSCTEIKQGTQRWRNTKLRYFGGNDCASLNGVGFQDPSQVIHNKISGTEPTYSAETLELMERGLRYEPIVRGECEKRHGYTIRETGLRAHRQIYYLTASPDGYCPQEGYLTEFKVRRELTDKIPEKYWIQMQVQMEVWNIDKCLYCENLIVESDTEPDDNHPKGQLTDPTGVSRWWSLRDFKEVIIERDRTWFTDTMKPLLAKYWALIQAGRPGASTRSRAQDRKRAAAAIDAGEVAVERPDEVINRELRKRQKYLERIENMILPYMMSNTARKDPLLDWLALYGDTSARDKDPNPFLSMIRRKNREFFSAAIGYIKAEHPGLCNDVDPDPIFTQGMRGASTNGVFDAPDIVEAHNHKIGYDKLTATKAAMERGDPIIFNPCFCVERSGYPYYIGGRADMIVRDDHVPAIFGLQVPPEGDQHYYVLVSFRYATINLRADGVHLLNNAKQAAYKSQMWLLNEALGIMQNFTPKLALIIGRKYDYTVRTVRHKIDNAFGAIGVIDYGEVDEQYVETCVGALKWLSDIRAPEAANWDLEDPQRAEMYPNMKNANDYPWHSVKKRVATAINDITLMYRCGPKVRQYAHDLGITEWQDLTPATICYKKGTLLNQIMDFVRCNSGDPSPALEQQTTLRTLDRVPSVEFYMDFEAVGNMYDDFSHFPMAANYGMIFLIGLIIVDHVANTKVYKCYIAERMDAASEHAIVNKMLDDIRAARRLHGQNFAPIYFWSNAENYLLSRAVGAQRIEHERLIMIDLCKYFRTAGLIMEGQMSYGLKEVARVMKEHGLINTYWGMAGESVADGLSAMIEAIRTYRYRPDCKESFYKCVTDYNYVDCKVMEEIVQFLRT